LQAQALTRFYIVEAEKLNIKKIYSVKAGMQSLQQCTHAILMAGTDLNVYSS
jgi:hypothetical protein